MDSLKKLVLLSAFSFSFVSCGLVGGAAEEEPEELPVGNYEHTYYTISDTLAADPELENRIRPHINAVQELTARVLTRSDRGIERGQPEGALGNMVADLIRSRASAEMGRNVDVAVINNGGLRTPLPEGEITIGMIYELMPFENIIVVQEHTGRQLRQMADQIAAVGGEPVSGMRMRISGDGASQVMVGSEPIDPDRTYLVATNNWMADGGGPITTLHQPEERHNLQVLIRDAIIDYLDSRESISPETDRRVRN